MVKDATQANRFIKIETPFGADNIFIQRIAGEEGFSQLFEYHLTLIAAPDKSFSAKDIVGKTVTITIEDHAGGERPFHGYVNRFEYRGQDDQQAYYGATIVPWFWFLQNRADCRIFQKMKTPDILKDVFSQLGFTDFDDSNLSGDYVEREYCVQYRETDYDFACRLMEEEGIFYYFKHDKGAHTMILADSKSAYYDLDDNELEFLPSQTSDHFRQLESWRHCYEFRPGKIAMTDYDFKKPTNKLLTDDSSQIGYEMMDKLEVYDFPGRYLTKGHGRQFTKIRVEELEAGHDVVQSSSNYLSIATGGKFTVARHRSAQEEGQQYVVSNCKFEASIDGSYQPGSQQGSSLLHNEFQCIPARTLYRPSRATTKPVVEGPQTAEIVGPGGEEIYVDEHGRVKVQFHWDRLGQKDENSSCWIRVSQVHAGKGWGMIDIPRIGEEVIVSFLEGDPDAPIITGRVYNGTNQVPYALDDANNSTNKMRRGNTTKTYKDGVAKYNEMTMDDTPGNEQIRVHGQYNMDTTIENDETLTVKHDRTKTITNDETTTVGNNRTETVQKGNETITIDKGDRTLNVNTGSETKFVKTNKTVTVQDGNATFDVKTGNNALSAKKEVQITGHDKIVAIGTNEVSISGKKIVIAATEEIQIGVGSNSIVINKQGISSGGIKITSAAVGVHEISGALIKIN